MKKRKYPSMSEEIEPDVLRFPERDLWLAVIERAVRDYCFFFDKLFSHAAKETWGRKTESNLSVSKSAKIFADLRWFLFCEDSEEFNLQYLFEHMYDDYDMKLGAMRKQLKEQFKLHLQQTEASGKFLNIIKRIKLQADTMKVKAARDESLLKHKRFSRRRLRSFH